MRDILTKAGNLILAIPHSYASILFSDSTLLGLMLLVVTFLYPVIGLSGVIGLFVALLFSRVMGWESWDSRSGVAGFNSLIVCLSLGYYYPSHMITNFPMQFLGILMLLSLSTMMLYFVLSYLFNQWFRILPMSLPFSIIAIILWHYLARIGFLTNYPFDKLALLSWSPQMSEYWSLFFVSLGSIFFAPTVLAGIFVSFAIFVNTRIGMVLAIIGWSISYWLMHILGTSFSEGIFYPGFNGILIMLSIGGIFLLPGKTSWLLAAFATAMGLMINVLFGNTFHYFNQYTGLYSSLPVPVFAFPLNITVIIVILSLKLRLTNTKPIINDYGIFNPEKALQTFQERYRRFYTIGIPQFFLPISGKWVVTQGCNGDITHKLDWAYAWDFEIHDSTMKRYSSLEHQLSDYYSYGKPVLCSAAGYVVRVLDGVIDNEIGEVNTKENWGNYVCISHGFGLFSFYAHLKNNSITLKIGDYVKQSEKIGLVGNSGRSPFPHLHFQVQSGPEAGSRTRLSHIVNYKLHTVAEETIFVASDIPKQGETVSSLVPEPRLQTILNLHEQTQHLFEVTTQKRVYHEVWEIRLDFYGSYTVHSNRHSDLEFSIFNGVYNALSLRGRQLNALSSFAMLMPRLPYLSKQRIRWSDEPALSLCFNPIIRELILLLSPLFQPVKVIANCYTEEADNRIHIHTDVCYKILGLEFASFSGEIKINANNNIHEITLFKNKTLILNAKGVLNEKI